MQQGQLDKVAQGTPAMDTQGTSTNGEPSTGNAASATSTPAAQELIELSRYKELQGAYTRSRQEVAKLKAKTAALEEQLGKQHDLGLSAEDRAALEQLKQTDPEAWRQQLNSLEARHSKELADKVSAEVEIARRKVLLEQYNEENPNYPINDNIVDTVLPRGMFTRLERGEISFEQYLVEANAYLKTHTPGTPGAGSTAAAGMQAPINTVGGAAGGQVEVSPEKTEWW